MSSLFEQIGGEAAVDAAVDVFYRNVLCDDRISSFFESIDMDAQRAKQKAFLTIAIGGPNNYSGKNLKEAHSALVEGGLDDSHFDAVAENLVKALEELNVPGDLAGQVLEIAGGTREDVLGRSS